MPVAQLELGELEPHPIAERYPLLEGDDFEAFKASVAANGQRVPVVLYRGKILDGRNRYRACRALGIAPKSEDCGCQTDEQAATLADVLNLDRRHLTREQKRAVIAYKVNQSPDQSDRSIAAEVKVSPTTVSTVRKALSADAGVAGVQVGHLAKVEELGHTRKGRDGKKYTVKPKADEQQAEPVAAPANPEAIAVSSPHLQPSPAEGELQPLWCAGELSTEIGTLFRLMSSIWPQLHDQFIDPETEKVMTKARRDKLIADAKRTMIRVGWAADWLSRSVIPDWSERQLALHCARRGAPKK